jgi:hypothetical protein
MWKLRTLAFCSLVVVAGLVASSRKVKAEESRNEEPQPSVVLSLSRFWLLLWKGLRFRDLVTKILSLQ